MKKQLAALIISLIGFSMYSQSTIWQSYGSGLDSTWGVRYLSAVDANTVWAIGYHKSSSTASNIFTKTTDGANFTAGTFLTDTNTYNASSISAVDANTAFISVYDKAGDGTSGQILQTTNGGSTWANIASDSMFKGVNNFPDFVYFWDANNGIAVGDPNGHTIYNDSIQMAHGDTIPQFEIWQTINGGTTWTRVSDTLIPSPQTNEYGLSNSYAVYGQKIWFGTSNGRVYASSDSGKWVAYPTGLYGGANGLAFRDSLHGIVWGFVNATTQKITVLNTNNGGLTWTFLASNLYIGTTDFCSIRGTDGYMSVGLNGTNTSYATSVSHDDGATWAALESNTTNIEKISVVQMVDSLNGWAGSYTTNGSKNGMNKYIGPNIAGIQQVAGKTNQVTIYPNPAQDILNVECLLLNENTSLQIIDMLGNTIREFKIRDSKFKIELADMQQGMYLVKTQSGNTNNIQKLIIQ